MTNEQLETRMTERSQKAIVAINDIAYNSNRVSLVSVKALAEEWDGVASLGKVINAFIVWREALAEFNRSRGE